MPKIVGQLPYKSPEFMEIISSCFKLHNKSIYDGDPLLKMEEGNEVDMEQLLHDIGMPEK